MRAKFWLADLGLAMKASRRRLEEGAGKLRNDLQSQITLCALDSIFVSIFCGATHRQELAMVAG
jgi:hypothetical protein